MLQKPFVQTEDDIYVVFATHSREILATRFKGHRVPNFSYNKLDSQRRQEGGLKMASG